MAQTTALGMRDLPILVIDAETTHPGPIRRQLAELLPYIEAYLTSEPKLDDPSPWIKRAVRS